MVPRRGGELCNEEVGWIVDLNNFMDLYCYDSTINKLIITFNLPKQHGTSFIPPHFFAECSGTVYKQNARDLPCVLFNQPRNGPKIAQGNRTAVRIIGGRAECKFIIHGKLKIQYRPTVFGTSRLCSRVIHSSCFIMAVGTIGWILELGRHVSLDHLQLVICQCLLFCMGRHIPAVV